MGCSAQIETLALDGETFGRSRGGLTSKIHPAVDGRGLPLSNILTPGQAVDNAQLHPLLDAIRVPRLGPARSRTHPEHLAADNANSHPSTRRALRARRIVVARCSDRLEQFRALATRYARRAVHHRGTLLLAATVLWLPT